MVELKVEISPNALTVLEKRYVKKDKDDQVVEETEEMFCEWRGVLVECVTPMM